MGRGLAVAAAGIRCGGRALGTPSAAPALLTAARGAPVGLADLGSVIVTVAWTTLPS
ncbi:hypothetical protein ACFYO5_03265 [Streptomyces sp. NPDC006259]|uniref:hypothetical protein n=1 Tax=Streptomyces sp. NPDC006259 TaxID=3364740 RepID=UPI00368994EE